MTLLGSIYGRLEVPGQRWGYGQRMSPCSGQTGPKSMILSYVCGCYRSKNSLSLFRREQPFCVFHIVVKWEKQYWLSPECHLLHFPQEPIFFSWCSFVLPLESSESSLCFPLQIFPQKALCSVYPSPPRFCCKTKGSTGLQVPTVCLYVSVVCYTSHTSKLGSKWTNLLPCSRSGTEHMIMCEVLPLAVSLLTVVSS